MDKDGIILVRIIIFFLLIIVWDNHRKQQNEIIDELKQINKKLDATPTEKTKKL